METLVPNASHFLEMLERAFTFPVGIPAFRIDAEVTELFDLARGDTHGNLLSAVGGLIGCIDSDPG